MKNFRKPVPMVDGYYILAEDWKNAGAPYLLSEVSPFLPDPSAKHAKVVNVIDGKYEIVKDVIVWVGNKFSLGYCFPAQLPKVESPITFDEAEEIFGYNLKLSNDVEGAYWVSPYDSSLKIPAKIELDGNPCDFFEARRRIGPCALNDVDGEIRWVSDYEPSIHIASLLPKLPPRYYGA